MTDDQCIMISSNQRHKDSANRAKNQILFGFFRDAAYLRPNFEVKDSKNMNTFQIFPKFFIKTSQWGLSPL